MKQRSLFVLLALVFLGAAAALLARQRYEQCAYVPVLGEERLPNAQLVPGEQPRVPAGWSVGAAGAELGSFDLDGDGRAMQLIGIANQVTTPEISVRPGESYCFLGRALTDSEKASATRLRVVFAWQDKAGATLAEHASGWQDVPLWSEQHPSDWTNIQAADQAPNEAVSLRIRLQPSSDDRIYLDAMHVRSTLNGSSWAIPAPAAEPVLAVQPWPNGAKAALSFSFDWETAMGGLIHTRSSTADDPNFQTDPLLRAMRMRQGVTTTLELFRPYGVRATYYATGYNFLNGNTKRYEFMGNPTYAWATAENRFNPRWLNTPWFADDPYSTVQAQPAWYFGDLVPQLRAEGQDIQSHTFAHFPATFVGPNDWQADFAAWRDVAAAQQVAAPRSLAFPWSSSNGMSDADWQALVDAGITSVTRTYWAQPKSALFPRSARAAAGLIEAPRCRAVPGHETILACPDFYLTEGSAQLALSQIDRAIAANGMIDLWAHTEEVTSDAQIAAWGRVVQYAAARRDAGEAWIAPLREIADWQQALAGLDIRQRREESGAIVFTMTNTSERDLNGLTVQAPFAIDHITTETSEQQPLNSNQFTLDLPAGQQVEVAVWPA